MGSDEAWNLWAERVASTLDPITTAKLGPDPSWNIASALHNRETSHLSSWWWANARNVINDALQRVDTTLPDDDIIRAAACVLVAISAAGTPLRYDIARDLLVAVLTQHSKEPTPC